MKFTIKTENFSTLFVVLDSEDLERYYVKNEMDSVMRKLTVCDLADNVVCTVEKRFFTLRPTYVIFDKQQQMVINVRKNLNLLHHEFSITSDLEEIQYHTIGDFFGSTFSITSQDEKETIAKITRDGGYTIEILDDNLDPLPLIAIVIVIHLCCHHTKDE